MNHQQIKELATGELWDKIRETISHDRDERSREVLSGAKDQATKARVSN